VLYFLHPNEHTRVFDRSRRPGVPPLRCEVVALVGLRPSKGCSRLATWHEYFVLDSPTSLHRTEFGRFIWLKFPLINKPPHKDSREVERRTARDGKKITTQEIGNSKKHYRGWLEALLLVIELPRFPKLCEDFFQSVVQYPCSTERFERRKFGIRQALIALFVIFSWPVVIVMWGPGKHRVHQLAIR
jgi:hypothetical protein